MSDEERKKIELEIYCDNIEKWKYDAMEIRGELIEIRAKLANLYLEIEAKEITEIIGDLRRAINALKRL